MEPMDKRLLMPILIGASLLACEPPQGAQHEPGQGNVIATPDSSSGAPAAAPEPPAAPVPAAALETKALPAAFHGTYDESKEACGRPSEFRLAVTGSELRFHESIGTVRSVTAESPRAVSVAADYQGEGESWRNVRKLELSADGGTLTVSGDGTSLARVRCP